MMLEALQREMAAAIMAPLTVHDGMRDCAADGRSMAAVASSFIAPNSRLSSFERLEIYNRQYWFRILDALAEDFTALAAVLGKKRFDALAVAYLSDCPSTSFSLRNLGSHLPAWMRANPAHAGRRYSLALDVAKLEWANAEAFDGAGVAPLSADEIAALSGSSRIGLQPHVRLLELDHCIDEFVIHLHDAAKTGTPDELQPFPVGRSVGRRKKSWIAAHRTDDSVYYRRHSREEHALLTSLRNGASLVEALESAFAASRIPAPQRPDKIAGWFRDWASLGWLTQPRAAGEENQ